MISTVVGLTAAVVAVGGYPLLSWGLLGLLVGWLWYTLSHARRRIRVDYVPDLSPRANELLSRYAHYYLYPAAGQSYASAAATTIVAAFAVAVVLAIRREWVQTAPVLVFWIVGGNLIGGFKPLLRLTEDKMAHNELIDYYHTGRGFVSNEQSEESRAGMIVMTCSECGQKLKLPRQRERLRVTCPKCENKEIV